jgi:hypothetical protein
MVAENDVRVTKPLEQPQQPRLAARPREQVAGDADELRTTLLDPRDRALDRTHAAGRHAEMEIREVRDPQTVELRRQPVDRDVDHSEPDPARLEPSVGGEQQGQADEGRGQSRPCAQSWSFSMMGFTETTWRLNLSSDSSRPAATPTSCDRWRIGIP